MKKSEPRFKLLAVVPEEGSVEIKYVDEPVLRIPFEWLWIWVCWTAMRLAAR